MILPICKEIDDTLFNLKYAVINDYKVLLNKITIQKGRYFDVLRKTTHFGRRLNNYVQVYNFIDTLSNIETGEIIEVNTSVTNKELDTSVPFNFVFPLNTNRNFINLSNILDEYSLQHATISDNIDFLANIYGFEDNFNLSFTKTLGPIVILVSGATMLSPFKCKAIFDSDCGFKFTNIEYNIPDKDVENMSKKAFEGFARGICGPYNLFRDTCKKEGRSMRIYVFITEFGAYFEVIDNVYPNNRYILNINNSDHCLFLRYLDAYIGNNYCNSEEFGLLLDTDCKMLIPTLFDVDYERENFLTGKYPEHYEVKCEIHK